MLAFMTHQEMNAEHWKEFIDKKRKRDANKHSNDMQASTDMFTCKKCRSKNAYYELQTRSADEPATIFVTCLDCGKTGNLNKKIIIIIYLFFLNQYF